MLVIVLFITLQNQSAPSQMTIYARHFKTYVSMYVIMYAHSYVCVIFLVSAKRTYLPIYVLLHTHIRTHSSEQVRLHHHGLL